MNNFRDLISSGNVMNALLRSSKGRKNKLSTHIFRISKAPGQMGNKYHAIFYITRAKKNIFIYVRHKRRWRKKKWNWYIFLRIMVNKWFCFFLSLVVVSSKSNCILTPFTDKYFSLRFNASTMMMPPPSHTHYPHQEFSLFSLPLLSCAMCVFYY